MVAVVPETRTWPRRRRKLNRGDQLCRAPMKISAGEMDCAVVSHRGRNGQAGFQISSRRALAGVGTEFEREHFALHRHVTPDSSTSAVATSSVHQ